MESGPPPSDHRWLGMVLLLAAVYVLGGRIGALTALPPGSITPVFPSSGLALAAILLGGYRLWPGIWLGALIVGTWGLLTSPPPIMMATALILGAVDATSAVLTALAGAWLVRRFAGPEPLLSSLSGMLILLLAGGPIACLISSSIAVGSLILAGQVQPGWEGISWLTWWLGDTVGILVFTPLLLSVADRRLRRPRAGGVVEYVAGLATILALGFAVFRIADLADTGFQNWMLGLFLPILAWVALRLGLLGTSLAVLLVAVMAIAATVASNPGSILETNRLLLGLQAFVGAIAFTSLTLAAGHAGFQRTAEALAHSQEGLQAIMDHASSVIYLKDPEQRFLLINRHGEALFGHPASEILGRTADELIDPGAAAVMREHGAQVIATGMPQRFELAIPQADDIHCFWAEKFPLFDAQGRIFAIGGIATDITARKQAEQDLQRMVALLSAQQETIPDGMLVVDEAGHAVSYNRQFQTMWRIPPELVAIGDDSRLLQYVASSLRDPEAFAARVQALYHEPQATARDEIALRDGRVFERYTAPLTGKDGTYYGRLWLFRDITARKESERQRQHIQALQQADSLKNQFLNILSHELRTPLTIITGYTAILQRGIAGPLTPRQQTYVHKVTMAADSMLRLVTDLLDMSRILAGSFSILPRPISLAGTARETLATMAVLAQQRHVTLVDEIPETLPPLQADPQRLGQVLTNLIGNALKFTRPGGSVRLSAAREGTMLRIAVSDTGEGVPAQQLPLLFHHFSQADMGPGRRAGGLGLGLSICREIVQAHGGTIGVESTPGQGSTFWFTLPLAPAQAGEVRPGQAA